MNRMTGNNCWTEMKYHSFWGTGFNNRRLMMLPWHFKQRMVPASQPLAAAGVDMQSSKGFNG